jgi:hypothetical protein
VGDAARRDRGVRNRLTVVPDLHVERDPLLADSGDREEKKEERPPNETGKCLTQSSEILQAARFHSNGSIGRFCLAEERTIYAQCSHHSRRRHVVFERRRVAAVLATRA